MQQDNQYNGADVSGGPYSFSTSDAQSHHGIGNYYELGHLARMESPLRYSDSSRRSFMHQAQTGFDASNTFHSEIYHLSDQLPLPEGAHGHSSAPRLPFSQQSAHSDTNTAGNVDGNFYDPLNSHLGEMAHRYMPDMALTPHMSQQHDGPDDFQAFTYAQTPNETYMQVPLPSMDNRAIHIASELPAARPKHRSLVDEFMRDVTTVRGIPLDHNYASLGSADQSGSAYLESSQRLSSASHRLDASSDDMGNTAAPADPVPPPVAVVKKKKSKMHDCEICGKKFPRPSGLRTHMNTHNNVKPYPCSFPGCTRSFAVRSNAKRHLRTHGIIPPSATPSSSVASSSATPYVIGFSPPTVVQAPEGAESHQMRRTPVMLRWMPPSLSMRTNAARLRPFSDVGESDVEEDDDDYEESPRGVASDSRERSASFHSDCGEGSSKISKLNRSGRLALSIPLRAVVPTSPLLLSTSRPASLNQSIFACGANINCCARHEERNSFREASSHPYHPSQFRILPGPAILRPSLMV